MVKTTPVKFVRDAEYESQHRTISVSQKPAMGQDLFGGEVRAVGGFESHFHTERMIHGDIRKYVLRSQAHLDKHEKLGAMNLNGVRLSEAALDRMIAESLSGKQLKSAGFPAMPKGIREYVIAQLVKRQLANRKNQIRQNDALKGTDSHIDSRMNHSSNHHTLSKDQRGLQNLSTMGPEEHHSSKNGRVPPNSSILGSAGQSSSIGYDFSNGWTVYAVRDSNVLNKYRQHSQSMTVNPGKHSEGLIGNGTNSGKSFVIMGNQIVLSKMHGSRSGELLLNSTCAGDSSDKGSQTAGGKVTHTSQQFGRKVSRAFFLATGSPSGFGTAPIRHQQSMENGPPQMAISLSKQILNTRKNRGLI
jgi:hypothetical protein